MLPLDLNLHVQFYLVASSHYLYPEQCPVVNSDIKGSLKIDWKREIYLKKDAVTLRLQHHKWQSKWRNLPDCSEVKFFSGTYCPDNSKFLRTDINQVLWNASHRSHLAYEVRKLTTSLMQFELHILVLRHFQRQVLYIPIPSAIVYRKKLNH